MVVCFASQIDRAEPFYDWREIVRRGGQIEKASALCASLFIDLAQQLLQPRKRVLVVEITREVIEPLLQPLPDFRLDLIGSELAHVVAEPPAKFFIIHLGASDANH